MNFAPKTSTNYALMNLPRADQMYWVTLDNKFYNSAMETVQRLLEGKNDQYGGFIVDENLLPKDKGEFEQLLIGIFQTKLF
jgi:hypothetical protein